MTHPQPQNPETYAANRERLSKRVRFALRESGVDIPSHAMMEELVALLVDERTEVRDLCAGLVETLIDHYDALNQDQMERLAYCIRNSFVDDDGEIRLSFPDQEPR